MDKELARHILLRYRHGQPVDPADRELVEALRVAATDAELDEWLGRQADFHAAVRERLAEIPVPENLKGSILAQRPNVVTLFPRRAVLLATAAALAVVIGGLGWWLRAPREDQTFAGFRSRMVGFAVREYRMDLLTNDPAELRQYLASKGAPTDYVLTPALAKTAVKGGARLSWQTHPVSMVCFQLPPAATVYLFVLDRSAIRTGKLPPPDPELESGRRLSIATWSRGDKLYLLAAPVPEEQLRKLLSNQNAHSGPITLAWC